MKNAQAFHSSDAGEEEIAEEVEVLRSGWLITGPRVREFKREFAAMVGEQRAVAVNPSLPLYSRMTEDENNRVINTVRTLAKKNRR
jgi:dTDP-4-amino-4,6-dideoxygalactose transaminase